MAQKYSSRRFAKRYAHKSKRNFIITLIIVAAILYFTFIWVLPSFIGGVGFIEGWVKPQSKVQPKTVDDTTLAPPVLSIPFEATNTAQIDIAGYGSSGSKVKLFLDDKEIQTTDVSADGNFTFSQIPLNLGTNNFYAKTIDSDKESLPSKTFQLTYTNQKPTLTITEPDDNKQIQGGDKTIKISGKTDPGVKVFVNDSQVIIDQDGNFSSQQPLNEGDNIFTIRAVDTATNSNEVQRKVTYKP